jgi:RND family efflux transporter MFP subunit
MNPSDQTGSTAPHHTPSPYEPGHAHAPAHHEHHVDVGTAPPVKPASTKRVVALLTGVGVVLAGLFVASALPRRAVSRELAAEVTANDEPEVVQLTTVTRAASGGDLSLPGTIQPLHESAIYARVGGYVKSWHADIGRLVHAGEVLAEIDAPELEQEVQQATHQVAQTHATLGLAKADLARWKELAADSAVSREEFDQKSAAYDVAVANAGAAEANLRRLTELQRFTRVTAPFTGVITARNIDIGSLISAGGATNAPISAAGGGQALGSLFRIAQTDTVRTYISVPQADALAMSPGLAANVSVQEYPNRTFVGHVARTSQALDAASRTLLTEVDVVNPGLALLSGMYARVQLHLERQTPALMLPATALVVRPSGTGVITVDGTETGKAATVRFQPVVVGRDHGGTIEIESGVTEGMSVVSNPTIDLEDGTPVRIAAPTSAPTSAPISAPISAPPLPREAPRPR